MSSNSYSNEAPSFGLDDFCVREGDHAVEAFSALPEAPYETSKELIRLNQEIAAVTVVNAVWEFAPRRFLKSNQDYRNRFGDRIIRTPRADRSGFIEKPAIDEWIKWRHKRRYENVVYRPGADEIVDSCINTWPGWGCESKKGSVKQYKKLLAFIFKDEPDLLGWFEQWLAYPIQNPGAKCYTAVLLCSRAQGVGKSLIGYIVGQIYGENFVVVDHEALKGSFNGWTVNRQFILGEEITGNNSRAQADRLKNMITREKIHVNIKYQPEYDIEDRANYLFTSNHVDALFLEEADRRVVVHEIKDGPKPQEFYDEIGQWLDNGGASHLMYYLQNEVDLSGFNPKAHAPTTKAKREMIALSKSDLDLSVMQIRDNPDDILRTGRLVSDCPLLTTTQLQSFVNSYTDGKSSLIAVSKALRRAGFRQEKIDTVDGTQKLWAVRDCDKLAKLDRSQWAAVYNKHQSKAKFQ